MNYKHKIIESNLFGAVIRVQLKTQPQLKDLT
jgi:hypothetical protein